MHASYSEAEHNADLAAQSYIVRWIYVGDGHSISWSLQPHKKSLNFGIFKHPGTKNGLAPVLHTTATFDTEPTPSSLPVESHEVKNRRASVSRNDATVVVERLKNIGLKCVAWTGKCDADKVSMGRYDVVEGEGGMYGLVFDNTFSKQVSKTATFVLLTHPTSAPPKSGAQLHYSQSIATKSSKSIVKGSPTLRAVSSSSESLKQDAPTHIVPLAGSAVTVPTQSVTRTLDANFHTGVLYKKRRKRNQGWARRFFSLDFTSSTLSYYRNGHSSALRGAIPLSLTAIGVSEKNREFSIDSGAEVWHLRAKHKKDFDPWRKALERASISALVSPLPATPFDPLASLPIPSSIDHVTEREWARAEQLIGRVSGSRDAVRRLAQDTDPKYGSGHASANSTSPGASPAESASNPFFQDLDDKSMDKLPFWKRKPSTSGRVGSPSGIFRRSFSAQRGGTSPPIPSTTSMPPKLSPTPRGISPRRPQIKSYGEDVHDRCTALLRDLDAVVTDFSALLAESKSRRRPPLPTASSRMSLESTRSQEFFDAEDGGEMHSQLMDIRRSSMSSKDDFVSGDEESEASSDAGDTATMPSIYGTNTHTESPLFPSLPRVMVPVSAPQVKHRTTIPPPKQPPPSIIGFLRKNAGKDLSTVSMPVSANEPLSLLQKLAEPLESAYLLSTAASAALAGPDKVVDRLIYVAAFAISGFAGNRVKERAIRKPFNPMLGETFELVRREDEANTTGSNAYRFVAEKVSHHPVRMAWQADSLSALWSVSQSPQPVQKFWGKSVELNTDGKWRLALHSVASSPPTSFEVAAVAVAAERYSWTQASCFLRNVLAGEKYVEPVQSMTIINESTGHKAVATFKAAGMFAGRSEDVSVAIFEPHATAPLAVALAGKWTSGLTRTDTGASVWSPGPLVPDAGKHYGFTRFAAELNEFGPGEEEGDSLPPSDSRRRPDQRALEMGELDRAEGLKAKLEERQRARRKVLEGHGVEHSARFFEKVGGSAEEVEDAGAHDGAEQIWRLKAGREGYWECRERRDWGDVSRIFDA